MKFRDKKVIITGASSGLGSEFARQFVEEGASVGIMARRGDRLEDLARQLRQRGGTVYAVTADVVDNVAVAHAVQQIEDKLGPTDVVIANAGVALNMSARRFDITKVARTFDVNLMGVVNTISATLPGMLHRSAGHIVGISSLAAYRSFPTSEAYCASKAALSAFLDGLRLQLLGSGVDVSVICPGFIKSEMTAEVRTAMPFLLDTEPAVRRMMLAIAQRKPKYVFPKRLYWLIKASYLLPDSLLSRRQK